MQAQIYTSIIPIRAIPDDLARQIDHWYHTVFEIPPEVPDWAPGEWLCAAWDGETYAASLEILTRDITVGGRPLRVGGIGGVMSVPAYRGQGYGRAVMRRAAAFIADDLKLAYALLVCGPHTIGFYSALGWELVDGPLTAQLASGPYTFGADTQIMIRAFTGTPWPPGPIDLCGLPW